MVTVRRQATYDDLLALPDNVVGELIAGELQVSPRPSLFHGIASSSIGGALVPPFMHGENGPGGWWILDEPELHFGDDVLVPDVAGWRRERMPVPPRGVAVELAPDWICEVLSPSTARLDRTAKLAVYGRVGIPWAWLVDPLAKTLEVLSLNTDRRWVIHATHADEEIVRAPPFEAIEIRLARWWPPADPPTP